MNSKPRHILMIILLLLGAGIICLAIEPPNNSTFHLKKTTQLDRESRIIIHGRIETEGGREFPAKLFFLTDNISISPKIVDDFEVRYTDLCITSLIGDFRISYKGTPLRSPLVNTENPEPICIPDEDLYYAEKSNYKQIPINYKVELSLDEGAFYLYPFDSIEFEINISTTLTGYADGKVVKVGGRDYSLAYSPSLAIENKAQSWAFQEPPIKSDATGLSPLSLQRSPVLILLTGIVMGFFVFTPSLIILVETIGDALQSATALFLGIWGFRLIILPSNDLLPGMIDIFFIGEYVLIIISLLMVTFVIASKNRKTLDVMPINLAPTRFYAKQSSRVFHTAGCAHIQNDPELVEFESETLAIGSGRRKCKVCIP